MTLGGEKSKKQRKGEKPYLYICGYKKEPCEGKKQPTANFIRPQGTKQNEKGEKGMTTRLF